MKIRLYFILSGENLFHPYYFSGILSRLDNNKYQVVGATIPKEHYPKGILYFINRQFSLWGFIGFAWIVTLDRYRSIFSSLRNVARKYKIPVIEVKNVNSKEHLDYLESLDIDIVISSQGQIFKKELLALPKIACINRHTALLPEYGGVTPVFWAMYNKEKEFGVSVHYMVEEVDGGDILYQEAIPIKRKDSLFKNYIFAFDKSIYVTLGALQNLERGKVVKRFYPNDKQYFSFPKPETINDFKRSFKTFSISDIPFFYKTSQV